MVICQFFVIFHFEFVLKNGTFKPKSSRGLKEAQKIVNFSNLSGEERRLAELMEKYEDVYYQVMKRQP